MAIPGVVIPKQRASAYLLARCNWVKIRAAPEQNAEEEMGHARLNSGEVRTVLALVLLAASFAVAASGLAAEDRVRLPQDHAYQKVLRAYMAILKEQDFDHGVTEPITARPSSRDPEYQLRNYIMTMMQQPRRKRPAGPGPVPSEPRPN